MPKTERKVYTYDQLDRTLRKRGVKGHPYTEARLRGNVWATVSNAGSCSIRIRYKGSERGFDIARVWKGPNGDTLYAVGGCPDEIRKTPKLRAAYRGYVQRLTPRTITGRTPRFYSTEWFRVHDGGFVPIPAPRGAGGTPRNYSLLYPTCIEATLPEWLEPAKKKQLPKFVARSRAFVVNLRRELAGSLPCKVQLFTTEQMSAESAYQMNFSTPALKFHVCTPPTSGGMGHRLLVSTCPHSSESRSHFHVDGDYAMRHSQFVAMEPKSVVQRQPVMRWPSARDAIAGIKEWVLSTIYIPGPM